MTEKELLEKLVILYNLSEKEVEWGIMVYAGKSKEYMPGIYIHDSECVVGLTSRRFYTIITLKDFSYESYPAEWQEVDGKTCLVAKEHPEIFVETSVEAIWDLHKLSLYGPWMEEEELPE